MTEAADVIDAIGPRLRALRHNRRITLAQLADQTGLTSSTLSRLENGRVRPTLEQLLPLAQAYGLPLDDLVNAPRTGDPRVHLRPVRRYGLTFVPLSVRAGGIQAYKVIHPPAARRRRVDLQMHDGYEWLYVLDGSVDLVLGEQRVTLTPGEAAEFDTRTPHWIGNTTDRAAEVLMLFGAQGERVHVAHQGR